MHPAYSVIVFTTASGAGYGLLFWLSLAYTLGVLPQDRWLAFISMIIALILITAGLLASTFHLGHPERALGAFSQWRSSWLSREGIAAVATYVPSSLLALFWLLGIETGIAVFLALLAAMGAATTVYCTSMIYASLRTIRQWHLWLVPLVYLALAASTGALLLTGLLALFGDIAAWPGVLALTSLAVAGVLKLAYWHRIDTDHGQYTVEMATGLGRFGTVRPLDLPHTQPNFVMREMGYAIARKHAKRLRRGVFVTLFALPAMLLVLGLMGHWVAVLTLLAIITSALGIVIERWLFFAEAEHVSQLYYGVRCA